MNKYISKILDLIEKQVNSSKKVVIIKLEGFETPIIYKEICNYFKNNLKYNFVAKLSQEKYNEFMLRNDSEWNIALSYLKDNDFIVDNEPMTRYRNDSVNITAIDDKCNLILLMGTESVEDKGGLADFYCISPELIIKKLKDNYSSWLKEAYPDIINDRSNRKAINTLFKVLFKYINIDLISFSNLIERLEGIELHTIDDIIEEICFILSEYWEIPSIRQKKKIPKSNALKQGKISSGAIIEKSFKFITRLQFAKGITKKNLEKYEEKLKKYAEDNVFNVDDQFPEDDSIFSSYNEFKEDVIDFISGKNYETLRRKFLRLDYSVIDEIFNFKIDTEKQPPKEKEYNVYGEPLQVYTNMISKMIILFKNEYSALPNNIEFEVNSIKLTNCSSDEEANQLLYILGNRLGGILEFFNASEGNKNIGNIEMRYKDEDPFYRDNISEINKDISNNMNELCKINFRIRAFNDNGETEKIVTYLFNVMDPWVNDFKILNEEYMMESFGDSIQVPLYTKCTNIAQYVSCETDEEFFIKLQKMSSHIYNSEFQVEISKVNNDKIISEYGNLVYEYKEFIKEYMNYGVYRTYVLNKSCNKVFLRYSNLLKVVQENYDRLTSTNKEVIKLMLNLFVIGDKDFTELVNGKLGNIILAPYHPVMLEKIYYKAEFFKSKLDELITHIHVSDRVNEKDIEKEINNSLKMCWINSGFDLYTFNSLEENNVSKIFGGYSIYSVGESNNVIIDSGVRNDLFDTEELDKSGMAKINHKSEIISQNIVDYVLTFPARADGINLLFVNPNEMQHIVSGIHFAVDKLKNELEKVSINIRLLVSYSKMGGREYLKYWLDNSFEKSNDISIKTYLNVVDFKSENIVDIINDYNKYQDITYIYDVLDKVSIDFVRSSEFNSDDMVKYPAIHIPLPVSLSQRNRIIDISQQQFMAANAHLQLNHKILRPNDIEGNYRIVRKMQIDNEKLKFIDTIHEKSKWVICLDEGIDKNTIDEDNSKIIGFSTGKGLFGELNTTLSARNDVIKDLQMKLRNRLLTKFDKWLPDIAEKAANNCINISKDLDGAQMLKALNPNNTQLHNYLAYVLTMQAININKEKDNVVIRSLINLDNYIHWFSDDPSSDTISNNKLRPDFLLLEIENNDDIFYRSVPLRIEATIIECKMAKENEGYLEEAKEQVTAGIKKLGSKFNTENKSTSRRYWFNQLYRALIFSKINLDDNETGYNILVDKISDIYNGNFEIEWNARVYAYWTNVNNDRYDRYDFELPEDINVNVNKCSIYTAGQLFIQKLLVPEDIRNTIDYKYSIEHEIEEGESIFDVLENDESIYDDSERNVNIETSERYNSSDIEESNSEMNFQSLDELKETDEESINSLLENEQIEQKLMNNSNDFIKEKGKSFRDIRFLLGKDIRTHEKYYWEYANKELNNRHLLINGNSGSGKTYCIQTLILEAVKNDISVIVFDYTDGFTKSKLSSVLLDKLGEKFESRLIKYEKLPINPFRKGTINTEHGEMQELDQDVANRIADSFTKVYSFGEQQRNAIYVAVRDSLKEVGENMTLETLREKLKENKGKTASTVLSKIEPLVDYEPFLGDTDFSWKDIIDAKGKMYVIQLTGFTREIQLILTELILWDIWNYAVKYGNEETPIPLVLDEAQNLCHDENSPSGKILAEGRKFGISGWYATQFMAGRLSAGEIGNLQQAAQKLYFSPPEQSTLEVAKYIDITSEGSKSWAEKLRKLIKGQCVTVGYKVNGSKFDKYEPKIIKITSLEDRMNE